MTDSPLPRPPNYGWYPRGDLGLTACMVDIAAMSLTSTLGAEAPLRGEVLDDRRYCTRRLAEQLEALAKQAAELGVDLETPINGEEYARVLYQMSAGMLLSERDAAREAEPTTEEAMELADRFGRFWTVEPVQRPSTWEERQAARE